MHWLGLILGVVLVAVGAFLVYYGMKLHDRPADTSTSDRAPLLFRPWFRMSEDIDNKLAGCGTVVVIIAGLGAILGGVYFVATSLPWAN